MHIQVTRLDPTLAEITIEWVLPLSGTDAISEYELAGRFIGPRCDQCETIELSYPIRMHLRRENILRARVLIPEPCCWSPEKPFVYEGFIELRKAGNMVERCQETIGLTSKRERNQT